MQIRETSRKDSVAVDVFLMSRENSRHAACERERSADTKDEDFWIRTLVTYVMHGARFSTLISRNLRLLFPKE